MRCAVIAAAVGVLLLSACGGSSSGQQSDKPPRPTTPARPVPPTALPGLVDCGIGRPKIKPSRLLTNCSDGDFRITGVHWSAWDHLHADGKGTGHLQCGTSCVAGDPTVFPIRIELSQPETCGKKSAPQFALFALRIIGPKPTHTNRDFSFRSNCPMP